MAIESTRWPWKPSLFNQYRSKFNRNFFPYNILIIFHLVRIANELHLAQHDNHCNELRHQISHVEEDITHILQQTKPIDFAQIEQVRFISYSFKTKKKTLTYNCSRN